MDFKLTYPHPVDGQLERFKYNQDLTSKCWLAVTAVFLALFFGKDIKL
jgi:hypothetical protein